MKICLYCKKDITYKTDKRAKFCNSSCAAKYNNPKRKHSNETKQKISDAAIKNDAAKNFRNSLNKGGLKQCSVYFKKCKVCGLLFTASSKIKNRKCCSKKCIKIQSGGYREGSGRSHSGYFRGIFCGSTYELVWVIYRLDHNLIVKRFEGFLTDGKIKYYPDFLIENKIIEIKGYHTKSVDKKTKLAIDSGYEIELKYKKDLKTEFDWVNNNYTFDHIKELYDDYKPTYTYKCDFCGEVFNTEKERKTKSKFCSQSCAGKGHTGGNKKGINQYTK